jgi:rare lipoprotein A
MVPVMVRGTTSRGTKKCRQSIVLVGSVNTMQIISVALLGHYCVLNHERNGPSIFDRPFFFVPRGIMRKHFAIIFVAISAILPAIPGSALARARSPVDDPGSASNTAGWMGESGTASYYGPVFHGRRAASGQRFNQEALTAAHPWLPFGTRVKVSLPASGRSVVVTINDRLYSSRRIVDLSVAAARQLGMIRRGIAKVTLLPT